MGGAKLRVMHVDGASSVTSAWATDPMKLLLPKPRGASVWACTSSYGGGMVAGDRIGIDVEIGANARCFFGTQASTKVYRNPGGLPCSLELAANLGPASLLVLAPDPVQMFADSIYEQRQTFHLHETGNLVLVDWLSSGRSARGERWAFERYFSRNEVLREGQRLLYDALLLDAAEQPLTSRFRGGEIDCFATLLILGPVLAGNAAGLLDFCNAEPISSGSLLLAASPVAEGVLVRIAATSVQELALWIYRRLAFVCDLLQDDPWARKW